MTINFFTTEYVCRCGDSFSRTIHVHHANTSKLATTQSSQIWQLTFSVRTNDTFFLTAKRVFSFYFSFLRQKQPYQSSLLARRLRCVVKIRPHCLSPSPQMQYARIFFLSLNPVYIEPRPLPYIDLTQLRIWRWRYRSVAVRQRNCRIGSGPQLSVWFLFFVCNYRVIMDVVLHLRNSLNLKCYFWRTFISASLFTSHLAAVIDINFYIVYIFWWFRINL